MATSSYVKTLLGGLKDDVKLALHRSFEYVLEHNIVFGPIDTDQAETQTTNLRGRYIKVVTSSVASQEVAVAHGLGATPTVWWQVGSPIVVNSQSVGLTVSRAADASRLYFASASTGVTTWIYVES